MMVEIDVVVVVFGYKMVVLMKIVAMSKAVSLTQTLEPQLTMCVVILIVVGGFIFH
jgi:hypothetical protein